MGESYLSLKMPVIPYLTRLRGTTAKMSFTDPGNIDLYERLRKGRPDIMGEALREFFKDELKQQYVNGQIDIVKKMIKKGLGNNEILEFVPLPLTKIQAIRQNLN